MNNLRQLILNTFLGGMSFYALITSLAKNEMLFTLGFGAFAILFMLKAIRLYDKVK